MIAKRWARALVTIAATSALVAVAGAAPARAEAWPITDSFENNPKANWWFDYTEGGFGNFFQPSFARTGTAAGVIEAYDGWASVSRQISLDPSGGFRTCGASIYAYAADAPTSMALEVIDAATWNYVSLVTVTLPEADGSDYRLYNFGNFGHRTAPIVVRLSTETLGSTDGFHRIFLDDFYLWCSRPLS